MFSFFEVIFQSWNETFCWLSRLEIHVKYFSFAVWTCHNSVSKVLFSPSWPGSRSLAWRAAWRQKFKPGMCLNLPCNRVWGLGLIVVCCLVTSSWRKRRGFQTVSFLCRSIRGSFITDCRTWEDWKKRKWSRLHVNWKCWLVYFREYLFIERSRAISCRISRLRRKPSKQSDRNYLKMLSPRDRAMVSFELHVVFLLTKRL